MYMPRILAEDTGTSSCSSINIGSNFGCSNAKEIIMSLHFDLLSFMSFFHTPCVNIIDKALHLPHFVFIDNLRD